MSLLGNPSVIFLDEPTSGLDPQSRITMWRIIKDLARSGITGWLFITGILLLFTLAMTL